MKYENAHTKAVGASTNAAKLLFQRVNYFLVATAFLIAGFATLSTDIDTRSSAIIYILIFTGLLLSIFFVTINYYNTRILLRYRSYILKLESHNNFEEIICVNQRPSQIMENKLNKLLSDGFWSLLVNLILEVGALLLVFVFHCRSQRVLQKSRQSIATHTYLIPLMFVGLWTAFLVVVLNGCY